MKTRKTLVLVMYIFLFLPNYSEAGGKLDEVIKTHKLEKIGPEEFG